MNADKKMASPSQELNWKYYAGFEEIRLWKAVLLTLNVAPTKEARASLLKTPETAEEYRLRRLAVRNALSEDSDPSGRKVLWIKKHPNNGSSIGDQMVGLKSVVIFAENKGWPIPDEMTRLWGIATAKAIPPATETKRSNALSAILAGVIYDRTLKDPSLKFKDIAKDLALGLERINFEMNRATLNKYVERAIEEHLVQNSVTGRFSVRGNMKSRTN